MTLPPDHLWTAPANAGAGPAHRWTAGPICPPAHRPHRPVPLLGRVEVVRPVHGLLGCTVPLPPTPKDHTPQTPVKGAPRHCVMRLRRTLDGGLWCAGRHLSGGWAGAVRTAYGETVASASSSTLARARETDEAPTPSTFAMCATLCSSARIFTAAAMRSGVITDGRPPTRP